MRNPDIVYLLKMEYLSKINIFGLKMIVKSGLEKIFLKFLLAQVFFGLTDLLHKWEDFCPTLQIQNKKVYVCGVFAYDK